MQNVWYLTDNIENAIARDESAEDNEEFVKNAIAKLLLMDLMERQEEEDETDQVQLMTLHASKGLEFPHVFLVGMEEELLPHRNSIDDGNIEEERRLAYVGITRAQKTLTMTLSASRKQFGEKIETSPSRFIEEIPEEDLEMEGFGRATAAQVEQRASETVSNIMNMFDD